jgi:hypothetical protein
MSREVLVGMVPNLRRIDPFVIPIYQSVNDGPSPHSSRAKLPP